jgi:stage V sporulation protein G
MKITDIRIFPVDEPKLKAFVSIIFDHSFIVSDIKIIEGNKGLFLSMPSKKRRDGTFKDIAHPLNSETRKMMEDSVIAAYNEQQVDKGDGASQVSDADLPSDSEIPQNDSAGILEGGSF